MNNIVEIGDKSINVLGSTDFWQEGEGLYTTINLKLNNMIYSLDKEDMLLHCKNGYCKFCQRDITNHLDDAFCTSGELQITRQDIKEVKENLMFEWEKQFGDYKYDIIYKFPCLDTYHFVLEFKETSKLVEIILQLDTSNNINLKEIKGSIPRTVVTYIKGLIIPELIKKHKLDIITSCFPLTEDILEYILNNKCNSSLRYDIVHEINSVFVMLSRKFSKEEEVREIMRCYVEDERNDKETITSIIKRSLVNIP